MGWPGIILGIIQRQGSLGGPDLIRGSIKRQMGLGVMV